MNAYEKIEKSLTPFEVTARIYDPRIGRWLSIDKMAGADPGITPYRYGLNNPLRYTDPDGNYEIDGHYWTVLLACTFLKIDDAELIAFYAELPDFEMNMNTHQPIKETMTWAVPYFQRTLHAFTKDEMSPRKTRKVGYRAIVNAKTQKELGLACHYFGDAFSHTNPKNNKTFEIGAGHILHKDENEGGRDALNHFIDRISYRPDLFLKYVDGLGKALSYGNPSGQVKDLSKKFVYQYITAYGSGQETNEQIFKFQYQIMTSKPGTEIVIDGEVEKYANALFRYQKNSGTKENYSFEILTKTKAFTIPSTSTLSRNLDNENIWLQQPETTVKFNYNVVKIK